MKNITKIKNVSLLLVLFSIIFSFATSVYGADATATMDPDAQPRIYTLRAKYNGVNVPVDQTYTVTATFDDVGVKETTLEGHDYYVNYEAYKDKSDYGEVEVLLDIDDIHLNHNLQIAYRFNDEDRVETVVTTKSMTITVPKFSVGTINHLQLESYVADNEHDFVGNSNRLLINFYVPIIKVSLMDGKNQIDTSTTLEKKVGDLLNASGLTSNNRIVNKITYQWDDGIVQTGNGSSISMNVPDSFKPGETHKLTLQAFTKDDLYSEKAVYNVKILEGVSQDPHHGQEQHEEQEVLFGNFDVEKSGVKLPVNTETTARPGDELTITSPNKDNFTKYTYRWENYPKDTATHDLTPDNAKITIPSDFEPGKTYKLIVTGTLKDGTVTSEKVYIFKIAIEGKVEVSFDGKVLKAGSKTEGKEGSEVKIAGNPSSNFSKLFFTWDNGTEQELLGASGVTSIPKTNLSSHKLEVYGLLTDGSKTPKETYTFTKDAVSEVDIEPWMELNDDASGLLVSLRNDSENDTKANKNFYMLDEEVTYYVDYYNAGKDIDDEVKLTLELPLTIKEISLDGGTLSTEKKNNVITWTFPNGLEKEKGGTKVVKIKYTALSKKSNTSEMIYPLAKIFKGTKVQSKSAVINCIYKDDETALEESHIPYMYGDKEKPTFRPDDGISRAEGAQVLLRIFGVDYSNTFVDDRFSDIMDTYIEARRAITKAAELKIIDGYTDGTYKPNQKMTRAEFMKIIASYIEVYAENEDIEGLEVEENTIKIYNNKSKKDHWAIKWVTLLARLNMTSVSEKEKDLRLEDVITRAEVAQLCNFYTFRAPTKISSSTEFKFDDVKRNHKLIGDIIEATRDAHDVYVNDEGKEIIKRSR